MAYLTEWITNIILFILLAIVIDLLLPNSSLQRYSKMVVGLLLIVIILTPILEIFNRDIDQMLSSMKISTIVEENNTKNLIENKKKEIQASQRAYILEQMAVQMEEQVEKELVNQHGVQVQKIKLAIKDENEGEFSTANIESVNVLLTEKVEQKEESSIGEVQKVMIDTSIPLKQDSEDNHTEEIQSYLSDVWQMPKEKIFLSVEGGEQS